MKRRLMEIAARKAELIKELEGEVSEERLAEIETEQRELEQEEIQIRKKMNVSERLGNAETAEPGRGESAEERAAKEFVESRATTIESGMIAVPTNTQNEVNPLMGGGSILDMVNVQDCKGMGSNLVPYEVPGMEAGQDKEGESTTSDFKTDYAKISPVTIDVYTEVSRECMKLTPVKYMQAVQRAAFNALRKKLAHLIVTGDADGTFAGIKVAKACDSHVDINKIDETTLRKIILAYGGDEDVEGAAVLLLTKEDLQALGEVRGKNEKKPVYEIIPDESNPNTGIIKDGGLSCRYSLNNQLKPLASVSDDTADVMYYGKPKAFEVDIFSDYQITVSEDAALQRRMIAVLGEVMAGGNVTVYDGFIKVKKSGKADQEPEEPEETEETEG